MGLGAVPNLSKSYLGIALCIISTAQQASPKVIQCNEPVLAQFMISSALVSRNPLSCSSRLSELVANSLLAPAVLREVLTPIPELPFSIHRQSLLSKLLRKSSWTKNLTYLDIPC